MLEFNLEEGESIAWQAKPAPRCYTFRHWRHSMFGLVFLAVCGYWQVLGVAMAEEYEAMWLAWLPLPFVFIGLYFTFGHLLQSRLEWNNVFYLLTDRRVIARRGLLRQRETSMKLSEVTYFKLQNHSEQLGTLHVHQGREQKVVMHCIEHPRRATDLLEEAMGENGGGGANV